MADDVKRRALGKLAGAAMQHDTARDRDLLRSFNAAQLSATAFKQQMLLNFGVRLHASELGVLMQEWPAPSSQNGEPMLDCAAFRAAFRRLGKARAEREHAKRVRVSATWQAAEAEREQRVRAIFANSNIGLQADDAPDGAAAARQRAQQLSAAMSKMAKVAALHADPSHRSSGSMEAFQSSTMTPMLFREQLKRNLDVWLSRQELAALVHEVQCAPEGMIDCARFMNLWRSLGRRERDKMRQRWHAEKRGRAEKHEGRERRLQREAQQRLKASVALPSPGQTVGHRQMQNPLPSRALKPVKAQGQVQSQRRAL